MKTIIVDADRAQDAKFGGGGNFFFFSTWEVSF